MSSLSFVFATYIDHSARSHSLLICLSSPYTGTSISSSWKLRMYATKPWNNSPHSNRLYLGSLLLRHHTRQLQFSRRTCIYLISSFSSSFVFTSSYNYTMSWCGDLGHGRCQRVDECGGEEEKCREHEVVEYDRRREREDGMSTPSPTDGRTGR